MKKQETTAVKSASVTLRANGSTLMLLATLKGDGTVITTVTTKDADKKTSRGMTETHPNMDAARAHLITLAKRAEGMGWRRGVRAVSTRPDAFSKLPAAPKGQAQ